MNKTERKEGRKKEREEGREGEKGKEGERGREGGGREGGRETERNLCDVKCQLLETS